MKSFPFTESQLSLESAPPTIPPMSCFPTPSAVLSLSTLSHRALCPRWALVTVGGLQHLEDKLLLSIYGAVSLALHYHQDLLSTPSVPSAATPPSLSLTSSPTSILSPLQS